MVKNTYGTGCFMLMQTGESPVESSNRLLTTIAWQIGGRVEYALEGSVFIGGAAVQWLRDGLGIIGSSAEVEALAGSVPDNGGVYFVPALSGMGAPYWDANARGLMIGLTRGTTRAHIARATLEGIALQVTDILTAMQADSNIAIHELRVDGGASANKLLMQMQADLLGVPVVQSSIPESTVMGAAFLAGLGCGYWKSAGELESRWTRGASFMPAIREAEREAQLARWKEAEALTPLVPGRACMNRDASLRRATSETGHWDVVVIGGGATGPGAAVDAASRGYRTLLVEQLDFAKATSSRSTKLAHGGVRYLRQGNLSLVLEALKERGRMLRNAPHLVRRQSFVIPSYAMWECSVLRRRP